MASAQDGNAAHTLLDPQPLFAEVRPQTDSGTSADGVWQMIWKDEHSNLETLVFTASRETRNQIQVKVRSSEYNLGDTSLSPP